MFLVVVLEDKKIIPLELVDSEPIASTILNSVQYHDKDAFIFQGATPELENFSKALRQNKWAGLEVEQIKSQILKLGEAMGADLKAQDTRNVQAAQIMANLEAQGFLPLEASKVISHVMDTHSEMSVGAYRFGFKNDRLYDNQVLADFDWTPKKGPGIGRYPKHINPDDRAKKCWQYVIKNFSAKIKAQESLHRQWIVACLLYQRVALTMRIKPWNEVPRHSQNPEDTRNKVVLESEKADDAILQIAEKLSAEGLAKEIGDEKFDGVQHTNERYEILTYRDIYPKAATPHEVLRYICVHFGFTKSRDSALKRLSPISEIELVVTGERIRAYVVIGLPQMRAQQLVGDKTLSGEALTGRLKKLVKIWFDTGRLKFRKKDL